MRDRPQDDRLSVPCGYPYVLSSPEDFGFIQTLDP